MLPIQLRSDDRRVIIRQFVVPAERAIRLLETIASLSPEQVDERLEWVLRAYGHRHHDLSATFHEHFESTAKSVNWTKPLTLSQQLLAGAHFSMEYSVDSAALFNPSICVHPDQSGVGPGAVRFVMSLRATGEGHVSSIVFRTGTINADDSVTIDALPPRLHRVRMTPDRWYERPIFQRKLMEMGTLDQVCEKMILGLPERFKLHQLLAAIQQHGLPPDNGSLRNARWLAESNYHVEVSADARLDELVVFPMSADESNGMEDLRLTRFIEQDGSTLYCGTYTAYNGKRTLPMMLTTDTFRHIEFHSLNGRAALNKGMALFPRRLNGELMMIGRIDGERLFIMRSKALHFWDNATLLAQPRWEWEQVLIGNCGPPLETEHGWILLTHGVGPMRTYSLGALILDLNDPLKIIGHLREPLLTPSEQGREGYVPNIVYSCGGLIHGDDLFLPFALADKNTSMAAVSVNALVEQAKRDLAEST